MSQLLGGASGLDAFGNIAGNEMRLHTPSRTAKPVVSRGSPRIYTYANRYWPRGGFCGDMAVDVGLLQGDTRGTIERMGAGNASRVGFIGTARDVNGAPLAGVTCSLFRTSDKSWIMDFTSRSDGTFFLQSWYSPDTHFIVFNKSGSPDVFGTTKQTLVGA